MTKATGNKVVHFKYKYRPIYLFDLISEIFLNVVQDYALVKKTLSENEKNKYFRVQLLILLCQ